MAMFISLSSITAKEGKQSKQTLTDEQIHSGTQRNTTQAFKKNEMYLSEQDEYYTESENINVQNLKAVC